MERQRTHGNGGESFQPVTGLVSQHGMGDLIQLHGDSEILQELYESGIDVSIACMARAGFLVELGMEGAMVDANHVRSYAEASKWLKQAAIRHYPFSAFGRKHRGSSKVVTLSKPSPQPFWTS